MSQRFSIESVLILGAGNVGSHLAKALFHSGVRITGVVSRTRSKADEIVGITGGIAAEDPEDIREISDLALICVSDPAISEVALQLGGKATMLAHTSGSTAMDVLGPSGLPSGVIYPLQTFSRARELDYSQIPFLIEASDARVAEALTTLAGQISHNVMQADSIIRRKVHIAAVYACNFSNHLASIAFKMLEKEGVDPSVLLPLMRETLDKLTYLSPDKAQTGPAVREDHATMESHLRELEGLTIEEEIYRLLSANIIRYKKQQ